MKEILNFLELDSKTVSGILIAVLVYFIIKLCLWLIEAFGVFKLLKKEETGSAAFCFLPFATPFFFGKTADLQSSQNEDEYSFVNEKKTKNGLWLLILFILTIVLFAAFLGISYFSLNSILENANLCIKNNTAMTKEMFAPFIYAVAAFFISLAVTLIYKIMRIAVFYKIASIRKPEKAVLYTLLSVVFYPLMPIFIFLNSL